MPASLPLNDSTLSHVTSTLQLLPSLLFGSALPLSSGTSPTANRTPPLGSLAGISNQTHANRIYHLTPKPVFPLKFPDFVPNSKITGNPVHPYFFPIPTPTTYPGPPQAQEPCRCLHILNSLQSILLAVCKFRFFPTRLVTSNTEQRYSNPFLP